MCRWSSVDRAHRKASRERDREHGGARFAATRAALQSRKPANDNRLGLKGWIERAAALALLIGLAALLAWQVGG
jgi:ferric-dicitrate binding protein FerR (iron transport regulator)